MKTSRERIKLNERELLMTMKEDSLLRLAINKNNLEDNQKH